MSIKSPRLCPNCRSIMPAQKWQVSESFFGETRACPDKVCGYVNTWTFDAERTPALVCNIFMNAKSAKSEPKFLVPGDTGSN